MKRITVLIVLSTFVAIFAFSNVRHACALEFPEKALDNEVGIKTVLGESVDLSQRFTGSDGVERLLSDFAVPKKPVVIVPVYFTCPRMCGLISQGVVNLVNEINLTLGRDFSILFVSFNPDDSTEQADERGETMNQQLREPIRETGIKGGWKFLVGKQESISTLMQQVGFHYKREGDDFAHGAGIMILTPEGKISQYFTGIEFSAWDVRLALIDASMGGVGSAIDHFLLYCFRFDPTQGKYTWAVFKLLKLGGILTLMGLGTVIYRVTRRGVAV